MKSQAAIERRLAKLEAMMTRQVVECREHGFQSRYGLFWDGRCVERRVLREILGRRHKAFCPADVMAGW